MKKMVFLLLACIILLGCGNEYEMDTNDNAQDETEKKSSEIANTEKVVEMKTDSQLSAAVQHDITKIIVTNGSTGVAKDIQDTDEINSIIKRMKELTVESQENKNIQGYLYSLTVYSGENLMQIIYVNSSSIGIDGTIYSVESSQSIIDIIK